MSQEAVERVLGRMITDKQFRQRASESLEMVIQMEGYPLTPTEVRLLNDISEWNFNEIASWLTPELRRA